MRFLRGWKEDPGQNPGWLGFKKCVWEYALQWALLCGVFLGALWIGLLYFR